MVARNANIAVIKGLPTALLLLYYLLKVECSIWLLLTTSEVCELVTSCWDLANAASATASKRIGK